MKTHIIESPLDLDLACKTQVTDKTMIASCDEKPTCKKCRKILKKDKLYEKSRNKA